MRSFHGLAGALAVVAALIQCQVATPAPRRDGPSTYFSVIQPILEQRCLGCHGAEKGKGGLRMHTPLALLAGGESGAAFVAGDAAASEIVRRMRLGLDDPDHMPPDDKPQPSAAEVAAIEAWIAAGASFEARLEGLESQASASPAATIPLASEAQLAALRNELVHVQPVARGEAGLWIDFAAVAARTDDALALRLLEPLREQTVELSLARSRIGRATLELLATMPNLRRLDLRNTQLDDSALAALGRPRALEELIVVRTRVGDASLAQLEALPALRRLYAWNAGLSAQGLARLRARANLWVDAGDVPDAAVTEVEAPPKFSSDAAVPDAPPASPTSAAVNTLCPVSGKPVQALCTLVHDGRVIAFCCEVCLAEFKRDPSRFVVKTP